MRNTRVVQNKWWMIGASLILAACQPSTLDEKAYVQWVEGDKSHLSAVKELDDISYTLFYKPLDYMVAKERLNGAITKDQIDARRKECGQMQYYTLKIKAKGSNELLGANAGSEQEYYGRLEYFMSAMSSDLSLIDGKDTLPCLLYHYERNYGLAPYSSFVLGFDQGKAPAEDKVLVYDDHVLGSGKVMIKIKAEDIKQVPAIRWN